MTTSLPDGPAAAAGRARSPADPHQVAPASGGDAAANTNRENTPPMVEAAAAAAGVAAARPDAPLHASQSHNATLQEVARRAAVGGGGGVDYVRCVAANGQCYLVPRRLLAKSRQPAAPPGGSPSVLSAGAVSLLRPRCAAVSRCGAPWWQAAQ